MVVDILEVEGHAPVEKRYVLPTEGKHGITFRTKHPAQLQQVALDPEQCTEVVVLRTLLDLREEALIQFLHLLNNPVENRKELIHDRIEDTVGDRPGSTFDRSRLGCPPPPDLVDHRQGNGM